MYAKPVFPGYYPFAQTDYQQPGQPWMPNVIPMQIVIPQQQQQLKFQENMHPQQIYCLKPINNSQENMNQDFYYQNFSPSIASNPCNCSKTDLSQRNDASKKSSRRLSGSLVKKMTRLCSQGPKAEAEDKQAFQPYHPFIGVPNSQDHPIFSRDANPIKSFQNYTTQCDNCSSAFRYHHADVWSKHGGTTRTDYLRNVEIPRQNKASRKKMNVFSTPENITMTVQRKIVEEEDEKSGSHSEEKFSSEKNPTTEIYTNDEDPKLQPKVVQSVPQTKSTSFCLCTPPINKQVYANIQDSDDNIEPVLLTSFNSNQGWSIDKENDDIIHWQS